MVYAELVPSTLLSAESVEGAGAFSVSAVETLRALAYTMCQDLPRTPRPHDAGSVFWYPHSMTIGAHHCCFRSVSPFRRLCRDNASRTYLKSKRDAPLDGNDRIPFRQVSTRRINDCSPITTPGT